LGDRRILGESEREGMFASAGTDHQNAQRLDHVPKAYPSDDRR